MRRLLSFVALLVLLASGRAHAAVESELVKQGMTAYDDLEYQKSIDLLHRALGETLTREEKVVTYRTLAFDHVALGKPDEAEKDFESLLEVDPSFQLDNTISPRVRTVFEAAQARVATVGLPGESHGPPVRVELTPNRNVKPGRAVVLKASYAGGVAVRMELFYRTRGQNRFSKLDARGTNGVFTATVPGLQVQGPALEYYVNLLDDSGAGVATAGSLGRPLALDVLMEKKPLYTRGAFWGGIVAGAVVVAVVAGVLGATLPNHVGPNTPATLTIQPQ